VRYALGTLTREPRPKVSWNSGGKPRELCFQPKGYLWLPCLWPMEAKSDSCKDCGVCLEWVVWGGGIV
jgi:hypothetical protein